MLRPAKIAALAVLWLVPALIFVAAFSHGWVPAWRSVGVLAILPRFADLSTIPYGVEAIHRGLDPLVSNPADPLQRTVNYPRIWLHVFSALGVTVQNVWVVALPFCALYLFCISVLIARSRHFMDAAVLLLAGISISPLLAMERGNNDLCVFALLFLGCVATNRYLKSVSLGAASLLKIFPLAGMIVAAVRRPMKQRIVPMLSLVLVFALLAWQWHDLNLIRLGTPISRVRSYGFLSLQQEIFRFLPQSLFYSIQLGWIVAGAFLVFVVLTVDFARKSDWGVDPEILTSMEAEMFAVFGGTYAFTYAIGSNWDYRLILLVPTLPFALRLARDVTFRRWAIAYIALVGVAENGLAVEGHGGTVLVHLASFGVFAFVLMALTQQLKGASSMAFAAATLPVSSR
jgi:hypothetical protein